MSILEIEFLIVKRLATEIKKKLSLASPMFWVGFKNKLQVTAVAAAAASTSRLLTSLI